MKRVLVAALGNILRGDDGFGPAVLQALQTEPLPEGVRAVELGIGGVGLAQELMDGYDAVLIVDALDRGDPAGTLSLLEPAVPDPADLDPAQPLAAADPHQTEPVRALIVARAAGALPAFVRIVGCQPAQTDELTEELSPAVAAAVPRAAAWIRAVLKDLGAPEEGIRLRDEILQAMYWLEGEGLVRGAGPQELARIIDRSEAVIAAQLDGMAARGLIRRIPEGFRLTDSGRAEGGRRFAEEFADLLRRGHGQCSDPECDCEGTGDPALCRAAGVRPPLT